MQQKQTSSDLWLVLLSWLGSRSRPRTTNKGGCSLMKSDDDDDSIELCEKCGKNVAAELHTCPYDYDELRSLCNCCDGCTEKCHEND